MASAPVELVRKIYERWERGDFSDASWADPEIEFVSVDGPDPASGRGIAQMSAQWRAVLSAWEHLRAEPEEYRELDDGRVLVLARNYGRGKASGLEVDQLSTRGANIFEIRDGRVTRRLNYWDPTRALADLGIDA